MNSVYVEFFGSDPPARSTVQLVPNRKGAKEVRETFLWTVEN